MGDFRFSLAIFLLISISGCMTISTYKHMPTEMLFGFGSYDYPAVVDSEFYRNGVFFLPSFRYFTGEYGASPRAGVRLFSEEVVSVNFFRVKMAGPSSTYIYDIDSFVNIENSSSRGDYFYGDFSIFPSNFLSEDVAFIINTFDQIVLTVDYRIGPNVDSMTFVIDRSEWKDIAWPT